MNTQDTTENTKPRYYASSNVDYGLYRPLSIHKVYDRQTGKPVGYDTYSTHKQAQTQADYMNHKEVNP